jgi:hypothetical protein
MWASALCLLFPLHCGAAEFVELTANIETVSWDSTTGTESPGVHASTWSHHCVVGTNIWLMKSTYENLTDTWWFTGTNLFNYSSFSQPTSEGRSQRQSTRSYDSVDGNPGRPVRTTDLLTMQSARMAWLAFCSGPSIRREGRRLFPPSDIWKEYITAPSGFIDKTTTFEDDLGLPKNVELYVTNTFPVLQYRVRLSTNMLGWEFPLEFHLAQYRPVWRGGWELDLTARGKVTAIGITTRLEVPSDRPRTDSQRGAAN